MASGNPVVQVLREMPPGTAYATDDIRPGASTPAEGIAVVDFDAGATEYRDYLCRLVGYGGGGLTFLFAYMMSSAVSGGVRIEAALRRMEDDVEDLDVSHTYDFNGVTDTVPNNSGEVGYCSIAFTNGADMDSVAEGEMFIFRVRRKHDDAGDDATGDLELLGFVGKET